ncbi:hypothetical protein V1511DRAFT_512187 [Dipodascopsis uninucleata]
MAQSKGSYIRQLPGFGIIRFLFSEDVYPLTLNAFYFFAAITALRLAKANKLLG